MSESLHASRPDTPWSERVRLAYDTWHEWSFLPGRFRMDKALKAAGFRDVIGENERLKSHGFMRCRNCRYWLWREDGHWHSLEPRSFMDVGGFVEMVLCPVCSKGTGARVAEGSGLLSRPARDGRASSNLAPSVASQNRDGEARGRTSGRDTPSFRNRDRARRIKGWA